MLTHAYAAQHAGHKMVLRNAQVLIGGVARKGELISSRPAALYPANTASACVPDGPGDETRNIGDME